MKLSFFKVLSTSAIALVFVWTNGCRPIDSSFDPSTIPTTIEGEYIVVYKKDPMAGARIDRTFQNLQKANRQFTNQFLTQFHVKSTAVQHVFSHALFGFAAKLTTEQVTALRQDPRIDYIAPNQASLPDVIEGEVTEKGAKAAAGQEVPWGINSVGGFVDCSNHPNVVYILDTGIDLDHPDLRIDVSRGYNVFTTGPDAQTLDDLNGHGTVVAGIIGAVNNSIGLVGVAAGVRVVPVKTKGKDNTSTVANTIAGLDFVTANARSGDVVNLSLGFAANQAADDAIVRMMSRGDIYAAAAAGNVENGNRDANKISPARVNTTNFYTISAHDQSGNFCGSFSCMGNPPIDFAAPGNRIKSTYYNGGYVNVYGGTTLCTAHASGILLVTKGKIYSRGTVKNDRDKTPDLIATRTPK
ncbi:Alkaline serine exoprotease A [Fibrisoma limi BUZ 3]|uniref:Alkaline serine exoprotease A n=1 Tax=Fibrisoma limi BUZ 3 TaxID=1185876 RepID=I2GE21_9BACT|nr:S8 family serine peptidase [Fibrisoma limi]CCH52146.1 Alkaline serine exoprotease A [Fibrisoma limi BUZ 3]